MNYYKVKTLLLFNFFQHPFKWHPRQEIEFCSHLRSPKVQPEDSFQLKPHTSLPIGESNHFLLFICSFITQLCILKPYSLVLPDF